MPSLVLTTIQQRIIDGNYLVKSHAVIHALKEGFDRASVVEAVLNGSIIEDYPDAQRVLVCGRTVVMTTEIYLHVVCEYADPVYVEFVTAYIPDEQEWESPFSPTQTKNVTTMTNQTVPICGEHQVSTEWKATTFVYDDDGVSIEVPNVYAWVCPVDGEASFTSDTTDELIETVRDLITPAKRARERRSMPTEYIVRVA